MRKNIISIFKSINFKIEITTNLTEVDFLDLTFNLERNTYRPCKTQNDNLTYIDISWNHPPQNIKLPTQGICKKLSKNSSSTEIFEQSKPEKAQKECAYKVRLHYIQPILQQNNTRRTTQEIIWFNPPFSLNVKTSVTKMFLQLIGTHLPPSNKLHKIFNRNTVEVNYSCTQNISQIIKGHNKKVTQIKWHHQLECNCRIKTECPLNGDCPKEDMLYKCTVLNPKKCILALQRVSLKSKDVITTLNH